ncbi:uncharacterized protein TNCV_1308211 [Trichonephila clavipes]|nr:uncharacterized protein TNCV_1308211 [Trichonephila clavipes]
MKIGNNGNLVLGLFDESTPCLMIVLMNCQTKLRINHLTAVKSVAILERIQENGTGRRKSNFELKQSYKESDIVNFIKIQRIKWAGGHVVIMDKDRTTKKVFNTQAIGSQRKGRPNLRGIDGVEKDLVLRTKNWTTLAGRRLARKRLLEKAKAHPRMSSH